VPAAVVFNRAASASYGPKKLFASSSSAFGSMVSDFPVAWPETAISLFAVVPSMVVRMVCGFPRAVPSSVSSSGRQSGV
jgi:hypothetical protein